MKSDTKKKIAIIIVAVIVLIIEHVILKIPCPIKLITGVSCAGCGFTRACICLVNLDIKGAFEYYPLFWLIPFFGLLFVKRFREDKKSRNILFIILISLLIAVYILRLLDTSDSVVVFDVKEGLIYKVLHYLINIVI